MDVAFGIICVILFLLLVLWPVLRRWIAPFVQRWMMGRMEDQFRRMAGMPTRKEEKKARRQREDAARRFRQAAEEARGKGRARRRAVRSTVYMLRSLAEDVEFVEIREFGPDAGAGAQVKVAYKVEEQIEDVEFKEIKEKA